MNDKKNEFKEEAEVIELAAESFLEHLKNSSLDCEIRKLFREMWTFAPHFVFGWALDDDGNYNEGIPKDAQPDS